MSLYTLASRFRVDKPDRFRLSAHDPAECYGLTVDKREAKEMLSEGIERLSDLQERLYADGRWSVLIVLQAMDAAGKDSIIKHVMSASIRKAVRCIASSNRARRSCNTISSGVSSSGCRPTDASAFSTARITRKC
jgi:polyphosphate kinase 2 (PPK2 family)